MNYVSILRFLTFRSLGTTLVLITATLSVPGCGRLSLLGTGAEGAAQSQESKMIGVTLAAEKLELFMEHPYLVQGKGAKFNVHLTVLDDGMPIRDGKLTVTATGPSGKTATVEQPAPRSPGIFGPTVAFPEAGQNEMALALDSDQASETIRVPVTVYADEASAEKAAENEGPEPEGAITFLKEQAWKVGVVMDSAARRPLVERLDVPGQIVPAAGAKALVTPPIEGRLLPPEGGFPLVGQNVEAGQVVAVIEPPLAGPQGVQLLVNEAQIQSLDTELAVKEMDVEVEINKAKIDMDFSLGVYDRLKSLGEQSVAPQKQVDEAERQYLLAKANYEGKLQLRQPYELARQKLQSMLKPAAGGTDSSGQANLTAQPTRAGLRIVLHAPISGTVTSAQATAGEFVDATKELFTIINLDKVWIEAKVSEYDLIRVTKAPAANFTLAAYPDRRFSILGAGGGRLMDIGKVVDSESRTVPVRYEIANPDGLFRIGLFANVGIETARTEETLAIPESALVDEDGRPTVYVQVDGENFQKRDVELGIRDSDYVEVKHGLKEGERVVVKGGYAIRLASVSAVIPAHGHTH